MVSKKKSWLHFINFFLDTPRKYWVVIFGYHLKKSFWGMLAIIIGVIFRSNWLMIAGFLLCMVSVTGHIYMGRKPYVKLWEKL